MVWFNLKLFSDRFVLQHLFMSQVKNVEPLKVSTFKLSKNKSLFVSVIFTTSLTLSTNKCGPKIDPCGTTINVALKVF